MALAAYALTTLDAVKAYLGVAYDTRDAEFERLVNAASRFALDRAGREFKATSGGTDPEARRFEYDGGLLLRIAPFDLRADEDYTVTLDPDGEYGDATVLVAGEDFRAKPVGAPLGVFDRIMLAQRREGIGPLGMIAEVEGVWGFPSVPEDVVHAVHRIVDVSFDADLAVASEEFDDGPGTAPIDRIPFDVLDVLDGYARGATVIGV